MISLFYLILIITFANANLSKIVFFVRKFIQLIPDTLGSSNEIIIRKKNVRTMINELKEINMTDEWAKFAKLSRKISNENEEISKRSDEESAKLDKLLSTISWTLRISLALSLTLLVLFYRSSVVAQLPEGLLWPFQSFICWSKEIPGGVTVPCWIVISSSAARTLSRYI